MTTYEIRTLEREKNKTKKERCESFEHILSYFFTFSSDVFDDDDYSFLDQIKQSIIIYLSKKDFDCFNSIFLENTKKEFYESINKLAEKHNSLNIYLLKVKIFMEDFYF